jgi:hypothetical protein
MEGSRNASMVMSLRLKTRESMRAGTERVKPAIMLNQKRRTSKSAATNSACGNTRPKPIALKGMSWRGKTSTSALTVIGSAAHAGLTGLPSSRQNALIVKEGHLWYK